MFYEKVIRKLNEKKVKYAITGGVALVLYGVVRFTAGLDIIIDLEDENLKKFIEAIKELGFKTRLPVSFEDILDKEIRKYWYNKRNLKVITFYNPRYEIEEIDIFIKEPIPFKEIEREMEWFRVKNMEIPVVSRKHLKKMKLTSGRKQDIADIKALEEIEKIDKDKNEKKK